MTLPTREQLAWGFYDWANSAFATTVMAGFFPIFFKQYWSYGSDVTVSTFQLGAANSVGSIIIAALSPFLGAIADRSGARKRFLIIFAFLGIVMTGGLYLVEGGRWTAAAALYVLASVGFAGSNVFYDALLPSVAGTERMDRISALGYGLGYLGGGLLFALNVFMVLKPELFGLADSASAVKLSFVMVALWWAVFTLPLALLVREGDPGERLSTFGAALSGFAALRRTWKEARELKPVFLFLVAYWLYIDGVDTVIRMAVDYGMSLGFSSANLMTALLVVQFVGFPAAVVFGMAGERFGAKKAIYAGLAVYVFITVWGSVMDTVEEFFILAVAVGLVQGGVQALSRSFYGRLIPRDRAAEFYGFYNMLGKFAAVLGPLLMGWVGWLTGSPRIAILSVSVLLVAGGALFALVPEPEVEL